MKRSLEDRVSQEIKSISLIAKAKERYPAWLYLRRQESHLKYGCMNAGQRSLTILRCSDELSTQSSESKVLV